MYLLYQAHELTHHKQQYHHTRAWGI